MPIVKAKPTSPGRRFVEKVVHHTFIKVVLMHRLLNQKLKLVAVTTTAVSLPVISVVVTSNTIV